MTPSVFERNPKKTLAFAWLAFLLLFAVIAEVALRQLTGLGRPVLFYSHAFYGYRLQPNQETWRFGGAHFKINNLGLRAQHNWDRSGENKILFLGDSVTYGGNHISNEELFSELAVRKLPWLRTGNAGIPNWGVENVYALVVEARFLPASTYVTTLIEDDFYRGLQSGRNKPWIKYEKPYLALQELTEFVWHKYVAKILRATGRQEKGEPADVRVERAALKLRRMDEFLKAKGYRHLILISPTREQVLNGRPPDARVKAQLEKHGVQAVYLLDKVRVAAATGEKKASWYQDEVHLTSAGHALWAGLIYGELARLVPPPAGLRKTGS